MFEREGNDLTLRRRLGSARTALSWKPWSWDVPWSSMRFFDEIESGLDQVLIAELVKIFRSPLSNPHGAQLIFSAHDTNPLNHLNRDEAG